MIIELESIIEYDYDKRVRYWPTKISQRRNKYFGNGIFSNDYPDNFWLLSEQYYTIAWTLYTASFNERVHWPYSGELEPFEIDVSHKEKLSKKY